MKVVFSGTAWADFTPCIEEDADLPRRVVTLLDDARRHPFTGLGKPETLRGELRGL